MDPRDDSTAKKKVSGIFLSSFSVIIQSEPVTIKQNESVLGYAVANTIDDFIIFNLLAIFNIISFLANKKATAHINSCL